MDIFARDVILSMIWASSMNKNLEKARDLIKIPSGRKRIVYKLNESGLDKINEYGYDISAYTYFRKQSIDYRCYCIYCCEITDVRKIAWSKTGTTIHECQSCHKQDCYN